MSDITSIRSNPRFRLPQSLKDPFDSEPRFAVTGLIVLFSIVPLATAMALDQRIFLGENVWLKPVKFHFALSIYLLTLAWFARFLPPGFTDRGTYRWFSNAVVFAVIAELLWIGAAAAFGTASHFNSSSRFLNLIYPLMGAFAVLLTSASLVYGVAMARDRTCNLEPAIRISFALGLILTFVLTVLVAGYLSNSPGHLIGSPETGARVPILGWSREVGDLRAPHFLATHAMHVLPLLGVLAASFTTPTRAFALVWMSAIGFTALVAAIFAQAVSGLPLIPV